MPFYLFSRDDGSLCISPDLPPFGSCRVVVASSWLAAKRDFGFDLTPTQAHLLGS